MENEKYTYGMIEELLTEDISRIFAELNSSQAIRRINGQKMLCLMLQQVKN